MIANAARKTGRYLRILACISAILFVCSCAPTMGTVTLRTKLRDGYVAEKVTLSDGILVFQSVPDANIVGSKGTSVYVATVSWAIPRSAMEREYTYPDFLEYTGMDIISEFRKSNISETSIPDEEDFAHTGYELGEDYTANFSLDPECAQMMNVYAGNVWGGLGFSKTDLSSDEYPLMYRRLNLWCGPEGTWIAPEIDPAVWFEKANSFVGEIPVYVNYCRRIPPALGGYEQDEFFACFDIAGYSYAMFAVDYTQQEFVDMLLAIINHYGAYPET